MRKSEKIQQNDGINADLESIKKQDIKNLQKTFEQFFGKTPEETKERSLKLKKRFYFVGAMLVVIATITYLLIQKVKFVNFS